VSLAGSSRNRVRGIHSSDLRERGFGRRGGSRSSANNMDGQQSIILVACCGPKLSSAAPAADLYVSTLFKKARIYAERRGCWFILSALHGLVDPTEIIAPYDVTLKKLPAAKRREWGRKVREQMENGGLIGLPFVALAGKDYVQPLTDAGVIVGQPMKGKSIGKQLQWLNQENG
jgi:hypothetical protein